MHRNFASPPPYYDPKSHAASSSNAAPFVNPSVPKGQKEVPANPSQPQHQDMFPLGTWRDLWAAILFYLHFAAVLAFAGYSVYYLQRHGITFMDKLHARDDTVKIAIPAATVAGSLLLSALVALGVLKLTHLHPEGMIKAAFIANIVDSVVLCIILLLSGTNWLFGLYAVFVAVLSVFLYFLYKRHIPLSAAILKTVIDVLSEYPAMLNVTVTAVVGQAVYLAILGTCVAGVAQMFQDGFIDDTAMSCISIFLTFSLYWTVQVVQNVALTTIAGVYATFYFASGALHGRQRPENPTKQSFVRASTWSFGSICFGSLIIALIQLVRAMVRRARNRDDLAGAIFDCLFRIIEDLMRYFNYYAYIHVAIYGKPYLQASKDVWHLLKTNGVMSIINDNIIGTYCFLASTAIATGCAIVSFLVLRLFATSYEMAVAGTFVSLLASSMVCYLVLEIIQSGATTTMVCLAEDPSALQRTKPELYNRLATAYSSIFYNWRYP